MTDELKSDEEIYNYLKSRFIYTQDCLFRNYGCSFVHKYGEACGKTNKINSALTKIKNFILENKLYYGYWMFYSLNSDTTIEFETYLNIYKLFDKETSIQGYLLCQYRQVNKENAKDYEMIRLLQNSSDKCINENWYMAINYDFFSSSLYSFLLRKNVSKEELDKCAKRYTDYEQEKRRKEINKQQEREKKLRKEKRKQWWRRFK